MEADGVNEILKLVLMSLPLYLLEAEKPQTYSSYFGFFSYDFVPFLDTNDFH